MQRRTLPPPQSPSPKNAESAGYRQRGGTPEHATARRRGHEMHSDRVLQDGPSDLKPSIEISQSPERFPIDSVPASNLATPKSCSSPCQRALENWERIADNLNLRWLSNGGKGRKITINCSGMICTSYEGLLRRFPGTLLSDMVRDPGGELHRKSVMFFDRHPFATYEIVNCYRDGFLPVKPPHIPVEVWQNELLFFRMHRSRSRIPGLAGFIKIYRKGEDVRDKAAPPIEEAWRFALYNLLEVPRSSVAARTISALSMFLVCCSGTAFQTLCAYSMKDRMRESLTLGHTSQWRLFA